MKFYVVRVNRDNRDTHAAQTLREARSLAMPDRGSYVDYSVVEADDPGWARLMTAGPWTPLTARKRNHNPTMMGCDCASCRQANPSALGLLWVAGGAALGYVAARYSKSRHKTSYLLAGAAIGTGAMFLTAPNGAQAAGTRYAGDVTPGKGAMPMTASESKTAAARLAANAYMMPAETISAGGPAVLSTGPLSQHGGT